MIRVRMGARRRVLRIPPARVATLAALVAALVASALSGCGADDGDTPDPALLLPDTTGMEPQVRARLVHARDAVVAAPTTDTTWGRYGVILHAHHLYAAAERAYARAEAIAPDRFGWVYLHARSLDLGDAPVDTVLAAYRRAMALEPGHAPLFVRMARRLAGAARLDEAIDAYRIAIDRDPSLGIAHRELGQVLLQAGRVDEALAPLERARNLVPADGAAATALAQAYARVGRAADAEDAANAARTLEPIHTLSDVAVAPVVAAGVSSLQCWRRALQRMEEGDHAGAIDDLAIVLEVDPNRPGAEERMGLCLVALGRDDEAAPHLRRALDQDPTRHPSRTALVRIAEAHGDADAAIALLRDGLAHLPPDDAGAARLTLAGSLARNGAADEALPHFDAVAATRALTATELVSWGNALLEGDRPEGAATRYREAAAIEPLSVASLRNLGLALERTDRLADAVEVYDQVIAAAPDQLDPRTRRAVALARLGHLDEAHRGFVAAAALRPLDARALHNWGIVERERGDTEGAVARFRDAVAADPAYLRARVSLGTTLESLGRREDALAVYAEILDRRPGHPVRERALALGWAPVD